MVIRNVDDAIVVVVFKVNAITFSLFFEIEHDMMIWKIMKVKSEK